MREGKEASGFLGENQMEMECCECMRERKQVGS